MKYINSQIKNILKVILSVMIVFSSILVINPNSLLAEGEIQETVVKQEEVVEKQDEVIKQEIIEEKQDETIIEEVKEETSSENVDVVQEEPIVEEETLTEEVTEDTKDVNKAPLAMNLMTMFGAEQTYTVTIKDGSKTLKTITVTASQPIPEEELKTITYSGKNPEDITAVFYWREYKILSYEEHIWDLASPVTKNLTLYVKFLDIDSTSEFDFRVKHKDSINPDLEFNTGSYTSVIDGYTYSYYKYETDIDFSYDEGKSGEFYKGSTFDLAIQESNPGDTIELLKNITIKEPITIWGDVNLDLKENTITYQTSLITKIVNFINYFWKLISKSDRMIIPVKESFNPAVFVFNATTTISNGSVINKDNSGNGHGIVVYSEIQQYLVSLDNLTVSAGTDADVVSSGYEGKVELVDGKVENKNAKGYITINSGKYSGNIYNYSSEGSLTINSGEFNKNPITNTYAVLGTDRSIYYDKSARPYKYKVTEYSNQAVIVDTEGNEISNTTLVSALGSVTTGQTIKLVQDVSLNSNLAISINGRSFDIDVNGHNVTSDNDSKINISDTAVGEVRFINSSTNYTGYVDVPIVVNSGIAIIESGYFYSITGAKLQGGYFSIEPNDNYLDSDVYVCNHLNQAFLGKYNYNVVEEAKKYVAINEDTNISYTSLAEAIEYASASDRIKILQDIYLTDTIEIAKSLTISLPSTYDIYSYNTKSFVISGQNTDVKFEGTGSFNNKITNNVLANGNRTVIFEIDKDSFNAKLTIKNIGIETETQNCGNNEFIAVNTKGSKATFILDASTINITDKESSNRKIIAIKNESSYADIEMINEAVINLTPCYDGCLSITAIYNSGNNSTINLDVPEINLSSVGNQIDFIEYRGLHDVSKDSNIILNEAWIILTNNKGISYIIDVEGNSSLSIKDSYDLALDSKYDAVSTHIQTGILSKGKTTIDNSSVTVNSFEGNAKGIDVYGGSAELTNVTVTVSSPKEGYCLSANANGKISVKVNGYYRANRNQIVCCNGGIVEISGGHYTDDVTNWIAGNYKCIYDPIVEGNTYDYAVSLSNCILSVSVANDGTLVLNYNVTYDTFMLNNPDDFGVRFTCDVPELSEFNNMVFSITETKNKKSSSNNQLISKLENSKKGVYSFNIPARLMDAIIDVEIMDLSKGHIYHERDYSVEKYYYDILNSLNNKQEQVYDLMRDLAAASLNFGSYCQETLNGQSESQLVNSKLDEGDGYEDFSDGTKYEKGFTDAYDEEILNKEGGNSKIDELVDYIKIEGHTLSLKETTTLRCKFVLKEDNDTIENYKAYYRNKSKNQNDFIEIKPVLREGKYCLDIPGIRSYDFSDEYELKIVRKDKTCLITYSPLNYIHNAYDVDKLLSRALYTYYKVARFFYEATR